MSNNETITKQTLSDVELSAVREQLNNDLYSQISLPRHVVAGMLTLIDELHTLQADHVSDADRKLASIMYLCTQTDGCRGIWKRIDETHELLECLQKYSLATLERCIWIESWLSYQYAFLSTLRTLLDLPETPLGMSRLPRPWTGVKCETATVNSLKDYLVDRSINKYGPSDFALSKSSDTNLCRQSTGKD